MQAYAGIDDPYRISFGVEESRRRLHRLLYGERRLLHASAGWFVIARNWEVKQALARHLWEDAEHMWSLYDRAKQLRGNGGTLSRSPDDDLGAALSEVLYAPDEASYLAGVYRVVKPALIEAYRQHMTETHGLVDQPTVRTLRHIVMEEEEQVALMEDRCAEAITDPVQAQEVAAWCMHLTQWLTACGGLLGAAQSSIPRPPQRADGSFALPPWPGRDDRFPAVLEHKGTVAEQEQVGPLRWMMRVRMYEMAAAEVPASVLFDRPDAPLDFYRDAARHIWDEVRHSMFGQAAIEADGHSLSNYHAYVGDYSWSMHLTPAERYAWLTVGVENSLMKYPPGKREEYEFCRDTAHHPLMTLFQDYDWADEVMHAQMGRQWAPVLMGDHATLDDARRLATRLMHDADEWLATLTDEADCAVVADHTG